jgi:hypothetical protein
MSDQSSPIASTPDATSGVAQSKEGRAAIASRRPKIGVEEANRTFDVSSLIARHVEVRPYKRKSEDPVYRPLRIFALDPAVSKLEGAVALVNVPYEPLQRGPRGRLFHVDGSDTGYDLEDHRVLLTQGFAPSRSDYAFQNQMVYAVCSSVYAAFKAALGRDPAWGFERDEGDNGDNRGALILRPRSFPGPNAHYDKTDGSLNFGFFTADSASGGFVAGERIFVCLSHDAVAHELTHALLDGLRASFTIPTSIDVLAFHEAFADLVAIFQHFSYREVVLTAIRKARGEVGGDLLTDIARPLGSAGDGSALRRAVDDPYGRKLTYNSRLDVHELGSVLVRAVFDAFNTVYQRKTERYIRLATHGTGQLAAGQLPADLQTVLAEEASQLASQFLSMCIRGVDYCPPVDLELGEFLRAVITADRELVPDDKWAYREAWIDAFRDRGIYPSGVAALDEDALVWRPPKDETLRPIRQLSFSRLRFRGDPGRPAGAKELRRQAYALGAVISEPRNIEQFGLKQPCSSSISKPCIESIRPARRIGPDGQVLFDIVAEISQRYVPYDSRKRRSGVFYGGSTVILGPEGEIRYVIGKGVQSSRREASQAAFVESDLGKHYWHSKMDGDVLEPIPNVLKMLHDSFR